MPHTDVIPTSASVASTGFGIRYIGNYAYAYSEPLDASTTQATLLEFDTQSGFIVASVNYSGYMGPDGNSASNGARGICSIYFNAIRVYQIMTDNDSGNMAQTYGPQLIIPPGTTVTVKSTAASTTTDYVAQCAITGRVHGAV